MDSKAKQIFERYSEVKTVYRVAGTRIYFTSKDGAEKHVETEGGELILIQRADVFPKENDADGLPDKNWKNDQIKSWMEDNEIEFTQQDTKSTLLDKVEAFLENEPEE
jgi:hypothetical protein